MFQRIKKYISIISITSLLFLRVAPALAIDAPQAPTAPEAPATSETQATEQSAPQPPPEPTPPSAPTAPPAPILGEAISDDPDSTQADKQNSDDSSSNPSNTNAADSSDSSGGATSTSDTSGNQTGNQTADGQVGTAEIDTGNATNTAGVSTIANTNLSAGVVGSGAGSITVANSGNGSDSSNNGSVSAIDNNNTVQNNSAKVSSNLDQTTTTGENSASQNVGDSEIKSGDANTSGTTFTSVNTNAQGLGVSEFSIVDDHVGDIVLDFAAGCVYGCDGGSLTAKNTGNGSSSDNNAQIDQTTNNNTYQDNVALVESNLDLSSNSGGNLANENTNGDSNIETGDANVAGNALTFANNNLSGGVYFNFVYIYGDLVGDIILPEDYFANSSCATCGGDILAANTGNGSNSKNDASVNQTINNDTSQFNAADIENNLSLAAATGKNAVSQNTGGDSSITSGDTNIDAQVLNVANSNISGGDWWLVLINEAGNWVGRILGVPSSGNYAGSEGSEFTVDASGAITAVNSGNGTGSTNTSAVSQTTNNTTVQKNDAKIVNNLDLSANTGGNSASNNTSGNSEIKTGDASIIATIVNAVNNNIVGGGRLFVTVVDVFGSWIGNFVSPGIKRETAQANAQGGASQNSQNPQGGTASSTNNSSNSSQGGTDGSSGNGSSNNSQTSTQTTVSNLPTNSIPSLLASTLVQVAGYQANASEDTDTLAQGTQAAKKAIKINLAWLLLVLPLSALMLLTLRKVKAINKE